MLPIGEAIWCRRFEPGHFQGFSRHLASMHLNLSRYSSHVKNLRLCHFSFSDYRPYFLTGGGINFIPNDDELVIVVEFPQKPTRPGYTAWQINYRTPDHDYWKYSKFPIDSNSESLNFSTLGLYEVEVVAINENDGILSNPKRKTFCECIVH